MLIELTSVSPQRSTTFKTEPQRTGDFNINILEPHMKNVQGEICCPASALNTLGHACLVLLDLVAGALSVWLTVLRLEVHGFLLRHVCGSASRKSVWFRSASRHRVQRRTGAVPRTEHCWQVHPVIQPVWQVWYWLFLIILLPYSTLFEMVSYCMLWPYLGFWFGCCFPVVLFHPCRIACIVRLLILARPLLQREITQMWITRRTTLLRGNI